MDRRDFYFKQPVTESELNGAFDAVEQAIWNVMTDQDLIGIAQAMQGAPTSPVASLNVTVSGPGFAYDAMGRRLAVSGSLDTVDASKDFNGVTTAVAGAGNEKYISVFIHFTRALSDPRVDGNSNSIFFVENESHEYIVTQGAEAPVGTASRPALDPSSLLLFDLHRIFGQTTYAGGDIDITRRQDTFVFNQSPLSIRVGTVPTAVGQMLTELNNHVNGTVAPHPATSIAVTAHGSGVVTVATNVQVTLNALVDYLDALPAHSGTRFSLTSTDPGTQLGSVQSAIDTLMTTGADSMKQVASIAALKAIGSGSRFANQVANVLDYGMYHWDPALIATSDNIFCIRPTDIANDSLAGRWCSPLRSAIQAALGVAQLDATSRVAAANVRNGLIGVSTSTGSGTGSISTLAQYSMQTIACLTGDILICACVADVSIVSGTPATISAKFGVQDPSAVDHFVGRNMLPGTNPTTGYTFDLVDFFTYTCAANGNHIIRGQGGNGGGGNSTCSGTNVTLQIRP